MEQAELDVALEELELRLERLRALYEQYFLGMEKIEPAVARKDVDRRIYVLRREKIRNTAKRFKLQTIIQRYNTFQQYWQRICREIENGTYKRHMLRAQKAGGELLTIAARKRLGRAGRASQPPRASQAPSAPPEASTLDAAPPTAAQPQPLAAAASHDAAHLPPTRPLGSPPLPPRLAPPTKPAAAKFESLDLDMDFMGDWDPSSGRVAPKPAPAPPPTRPLPPAQPPAAPAPRAPAPPRPAPAPAPAPALAANPGARSGSIPPAPVAVPPRPASSRPPQAPTHPFAPRLSPPARPAPRGPAPAAPTAAPRTATAPAATRAAPLPAAPLPAAPLPAAPLPAAPLPAATATATAAPRPAAVRPPVAVRPAAPAPAASDDDARMRDLHARLQHAKQQTKEGAVSFEGLTKSIRATEAKLREQHKNRKIDFDVVIKDGKAVVKPIVR